jgi:hypothetical protein
MPRPVVDVLTRHLAERASLRDLMNRMGHDSMRAALIYQHATQKADRRIADALERMLGEHEHGPAW